MRKWARKSIAVTTSKVVSGGANSLDAAHAAALDDFLSRADAFQVRLDSGVAEGKFSDVSIGPRSETPTVQMVRDPESGKTILLASYSVSVVISYMEDEAFGQ